MTEYDGDKEYGGGWIWSADHGRFYECENISMKTGGEVTEGLILKANYANSVAAAYSKAVIATSWSPSSRLINLTPCVLLP
jgi:hypothetical protein